MTRKVKVTSLHERHGKLFAGGVLTLRGLSAHAGAPMAEALAHAAMAAADSDEMSDIARMPDRGRASV